MNSSSTQPSDPYPQFNNFGDARLFLDSLRNTLTYSWSGVEHVIKFLSDTLQEKINYIEVLRRELTACQNSLNAKVYSMQQMDQTILHLQRQLQEKNSIIQQKESTIQRTELSLQQALSDNQQMQQRYGAGVEGVKKILERMSFLEGTSRVLSTENEELKAKLAQAEEQSQAVLKGLKLTEEQRQLLSEAINRELTQRANLVNAKAKEIVMQIHGKSQRRIAELEDQLQALRTKIGNHADPSLSENFTDGGPNALANEIGSIVNNTSSTSNTAPGSSIHTSTDANNILKPPVVVSGTFSDPHVPSPSQQQSPQPAAPVPSQ